jgi:hypothetical protein
MYELPTKADFERNLSTIILSANQKADEEQRRLTHEFAAKGRGRSGALIASVAKCLDAIHTEAVDRAVRIIRDFSLRMSLTAKEVAPWARLHLENLGTSLLAQIPEAGFRDARQHVLMQYAPAFHQRLEGALRDIEIGFIGGHSVIVKDSDRRFEALRKFYDARHKTDWVDISAGSSQEEQKITANICRQLAQSSLIEWKPLGNLPMGMGRITDQGVNVIEGNAASPIAITIDSRQISVRGSANVQIGDKNVQTVSTENDADVIQRLVGLLASSENPVDDAAKADIVKLVEFANKGNMPEVKPLFQRLFGLAKETVKQTAWGILVTMISKQLGM